MNRVRLLQAWGPCPAGSEGTVVSTDSQGFMNIDLDCKPVPGGPGQPPRCVACPIFTAFGVPPSAVTSQTQCP